MTEVSEQLGIGASVHKFFGMIRADIAATYAAFMTCLILVWKFLCWLSYLVSWLFDQFVLAFGTIEESVTMAVDGVNDGALDSQISGMGNAVSFVNYMLPLYETLCMLVLIMNFIVAVLVVKMFIFIYKMIPLKSS
jgi:hypothetical protein